MRPTKGIQKIVDVVAEFMGLGNGEILGPGRKQDPVKARKIIQWQCRKHFPTISLKIVGRMIGGKDHATVIYAVKWVENKRKKSESYKKMTDEIDSLVLISLGKTDARHDAAEIINRKIWQHAIDKALVDNDPVEYLTQNYRIEKIAP